MEQTLAIIKPDAVRNKNIGDIISMIEKEGINIVALKSVNLSKKEAGDFYAVHIDKPFYNDLIDFMSSGLSIILLLEGKDVIKNYRNLMGATNPKDAGQETIRYKYAKSIDANAVHGSDSLENAQIEIDFFFKGIIK